MDIIYIHYYKKAYYFIMLFSSFIKNLLLDILFINFYYCFFIDFHIFKLIIQINGLPLLIFFLYLSKVALIFIKAFYINWLLIVVINHYYGYKLFFTIIISLLLFIFYYGKTLYYFMHKVFYQYCSFYYIVITSFSICKYYYRLNLLTSSNSSILWESFMICN